MWQPTLSLKSEHPVTRGGGSEQAATVNISPMKAFMVERGKHHHLQGFQEYVLHSGASQEKPSGSRTTENRQATKTTLQ